MDSPSTLFLGVPAVLALVGFWYLQPQNHGPYPPGPKPNFLLGNLLDFPRYEQWQTFTKWRNQYGDLVFLRILGRNYLILNSMKACNDLFVRRGAIYADRPRAVMLGELARFDKSIFFKNYDDEDFKTGQRLIQSVLNPAAVRHNLRLQQAYSVQMLNEILKNPEDHVAHFSRASFKTTMKVLYGFEATDKELEARQRAAQYVIGNISPLEFIVDAFPILKHLPSWAPWHKKSQVMQTVMDNMMTEAFERTEKEIELATAPESFIARILQDPANADLGTHFRELVKWCAGTMYVAGETGSVIITVFLWAMCINPEAQKKAQLEIDNIVGSDRMPNVDDRNNLPYLNAVIQEVMRWYIITPLGAPHATARDDHYEGHFIPKGTIVIGNSYGIAREEAGRDPDSFRPERFLNGECTVDPRDYVFGYGRRRCPGRDMAEDALFLNMSALLACFNVLPKDENIQPPARDAGLILSKPGACPCTITPRSDARRDLVSSTALALTP